MWQIFDEIFISKNLISMDKYLVKYNIEIPSIFYNVLDFFYKFSLTILTSNSLPLQARQITVNHLSLAPLNFLCLLTLFCFINHTSSLMYENQWLTHCGLSFEYNSLIIWKWKKKNWNMLEISMNLDIAVSKQWRKKKAKK